MDTQPKIIIGFVNVLPSKHKEASMLVFFLHTLYLEKETNMTNFRDAN